MVFQNILLEWWHQCLPVAQILSTIPTLLVMHLIDKKGNYYYYINLKFVFCDAQDAETSAQIVSDKDAHNFGSIDHSLPSADICAKKSPKINEKSRFGSLQVYSHMFFLQAWNGIPIAFMYAHLKSFIRLCLDLTCEMCLRVGEKQIRNQEKEKNILNEGTERTVS